MRLHILSDLHLEFLRDPSEFSLPDVGADILVLAGDIHKHTRGIEWASEIRRQRGYEVIYVAGNHEYYHSHISGLPGQFRKVALAQGIHYLDNTAVTLNGVRFLGSTLWTDFQLNGPGELAHMSMRAAAEAMNDFWIIRAEGGAEFTPRDSVGLHRVARTWLESELATPHNGPKVVVTHHLPHPGSVAERFRGSPMSPAFASDLSALIEQYQPELWIHGHTHDRLDYKVGRTRVVCNPMGYPGERTGSGLEFDPGLVIEIPHPPAEAVGVLPVWACRPCSEQYGGPVKSDSVWSQGTCGICGEAAIVTQFRNYGRRSA